ncbi:MAG: hypothetical protein IJ799_01650, partial [Bacteroidales bacterium]|nr:hypothetical protein [Bacteroidales bacterium]
MAATDYVSTRRLNEFYNEGVKPLERSKADSLEYDPENQVLQLKAGDDVLDSVTVSAGGESSIAVADVSGASISSIGTTARIMWSDPADTILNGVVLSRWGGTVLVRKEGSAPTSKDDGTRIIDNKTRNRYAAEAYEDTGLEYGKTYYYRFFPYTTAYRYTNGSSVSVTPARIIIPAIPSQSGTITYDGTEK